MNKEDDLYMDYDKMSLAQLREAAKNSGLKNISTLKKQELQDLLKKESDSVIEYRVLP